MNNEKKIKLNQWITFALGCLTIIVKVVHEIVDIIPTKGGE